MPEQDRAATFAGRVVALFGTSVVAALIGIVTGILLARLLGPEGKGDYYLLTLLPATAMTFLQLGLPAAFTYYAGRGQWSGLVLKSLVLTFVLAGIGILGLLIALQVISNSGLEEIAPGQIALAFVALPLALNATMVSGIVIGRKRIAAYSLVGVVAPLVSLVLVVLLIAVMGGGVTAAIAVYVVAWAVQSIGFLIVAARRRPGDAVTEPVGYGRLFRYGLATWVGSLTTFFNYRFDVFLIALLVINPSGPLGFYSMAVGFAELVFFLPNAVSQMFLPQVAGAERDDSDTQVTRVARLTLLVTGASAVLALPAAALAIAVLLPAYAASMAPLAVLLPGVVALSVAKVVSGYVAGIGRPGVNSAVSLVTLVVNVAANLVLIPRLGIVGAAASSLISYTFSALILTAIAARFARAPLHAFWLPRRGDIRFLVDTGLRVARQTIGRPRLSPPTSGIAS